MGACASTCGEGSISSSNMHICLDVVGQATLHPIGGLTRRAT